MIWHVKSFDSKKAVIYSYIYRKKCRYYNQSFINLFDALWSDRLNTNREQSMTSDFDNDDIQDSSFPLEIDDASVLDQYGVWIKTEPRDISITARGMNPFDEPSDNTPVSSDTPGSALVKPVFISDTESDQLPDFVLPDFESGPLEPRASMQEDFSDGMQMDSPDDFDFTGEESVYNSIQPDNESSLLEEEPVTKDNFEEIAFDDFEELDTGDVDVPEMPDLPDQDVAVDFMEIPVFDQNDKESISAETFGDEAESIDNTTPDIDLAPSGDTFSENDSDFSMESMDLADFNLDETLVEEAEESVDEGSDASPDMEVLFEDDDAGTPLEPVISDSGDLEASSVIDESDFADYASAHAIKEDTLSPEQISDETTAEAFLAPEGQEEDFSSFLDDLNSMSTPPDAKPSAVSSGEFDDLDLDSFIDSFNESGGNSETEELFDDDDPVDIVLDFDEEYISDTEKIKAAGAVPESEFYDPDFGVDLIDETGVQSSDTNDLDRILSDIPDTSEPESGNRDQAEIQTQDIEFTTEFDDFLGDMNSKSAPVMNAASASKQEKPAFNLEVVEDEGTTPVAAPVAEANTDEDVSVPLFDTGYTPPVEDDEFALKKSGRTSESFDETESDDAAESFGSEDFEDFTDISPIEDSVQEFTDDTITGEDTTEDLNIDISAPDALDTDTVSPREESVILMPGESPDLLADTDDETGSADFSDFDSDSTLIEDQEEIVAFTPPTVYTDEESDAFAETAPITFDDISAVEQELQDETGITEGEDTVGENVSADLLKKIADELASIKSELAELKGELGKGGVAALPSTQEGQDDSGFFSDDDPDETIALTGDELNNILITADFTEEKEIALDLSSSGESDESQISALSSAADDAIDFDIPKDPDVPETLPEGVFEAPSSSFSEEIEIRPVTTVTDDISYLEGSDDVEPTIDEVAIDESDVETIDFNDEKLEEPILDEFSIDLGDIEASFTDSREDAPQATPGTDNDITIGELETSRQTGSDGTESDATGQSDFIADSADTVLDEALDEADLSIEEPFVAQTPDFSAFDDVPAEEEVTISEAFTDDRTVFEQASEETDDFVEIVDEPGHEDILDDISIAPESAAEQTESSGPSAVAAMPLELKDEIKSVLSYMDQLLESLPEEKIEEFAKSEHFEVYKRLFEELGIS